MYRVHFKWKGKEVQLTAKSLDLTHPYFVSIKDIVFKRGQQIIINPTAEDVRRTFGRAEHLMIPFQTVALIEEIPEAETNRIRPFTLVDEEADEPGDGDTDNDIDSDDSPPGRRDRRPGPGSTGGRQRPRRPGPQILGMAQ